MTNREIKFELAKAALTGNKALDAGVTLEVLYKWIIEEPEVEVEVEESNFDVEKPNTDYNKTSIREIIKYISKDRNGIGYTSRLIDAFGSNNINTIGDLLRLGRRGFSSIKGVGNGCVTHVDDALEGLYGIVNWNK